jgi:YVTN family beta-propeller protein
VGVHVGEVEDYTSGRAPRHARRRVRGAASEGLWTLAGGRTLRSMRRRTDAPERLLATVLFTDIVGSTRLAAELGDRRWRDLLGRHNAIVRKALKRHGGREIDTAGDGFFAAFDQPGNAIGCATELVDALHEMGIDIRGGIHMGEVHVMGPKVGGIAVHIASRVMSLAGVGEVLVSSTVRDLMTGSDFAFEDQGEHELKGVPGHWRLFAVAIKPEPETEERPAPLPIDEKEGGRPQRIGVIVGVTVIAVLAVAILLTRGKSPEAFFPAPNTVVRIDPQTGKVVDGATLGGTPISMTFGAGSIWVLTLGGPGLQRMDPNRLQLQPISPRAIANPTDVAVGAGYVWVTSSSNGTLMRVDPSTGTVLSFDVGVGVEDVTLAEPNLRLVGEFVPPSIWLVNSVKGSVLRFDPRLERLRGSAETIDLPGATRPAGIAVGGGFAWVADASGSRVYRIRTTTNEVVGAGIRVDRGQPEQVVFAEGYVWVTNALDDSVTRIDPQTNVTRTIARVGDGPTAVAAGQGAVWVANSLDGTIAKIDAETATVVGRIKVGFSPSAVVVGAGSLWVTLRSI